PGRDLQDLLLVDGSTECPSHPGTGVFDRHAWAPGFTAYAPSSPGKSRCLPASLGSGLSPVDRHFRDFLFLQFGVSEPIPAARFPPLRIAVYGPGLARLKKRRLD